MLPLRIFTTFRSPELDVPLIPILSPLCVSSRFFRTRSTGAKFKTVPVRNWLHITPISRIEWTLASVNLLLCFSLN